VIAVARRRARRSLPTFLQQGRGLNQRASTGRDIEIENMAHGRQQRAALREHGSWLVLRQRTGDVEPRRQRSAGCDFSAKSQIGAVSDARAAILWIPKAALRRSTLRALAG
jgi:hypothetical protein